MKNTLKFPALASAAGSCVLAVLLCMSLQPAQAAQGPALPKQTASIFMRFNIDGLKQSPKGRYTAFHRHRGGWYELTERSTFVELTAMDGIGDFESDPDNDFQMIIIRDLSVNNPSVDHNVVFVSTSRRCPVFIMEQKKLSSTLGREYEVFPMATTWYGAKLPVEGQRQTFCAESGSRFDVTIGAAGPAVIRLEIKADSGGRPGMQPVTELFVPLQKNFLYDR